MTTAKALKEEICRIGKLLFECEFISGTGGNISVSLTENEFLITPSKVNKGFVSPDSIVKIDAGCKAADGKGTPSSESLMHMAVYRELKTPAAVIHAHPPYATAFAILGESIKTTYVPEAMVFLGAEVPLVAYATPSTPEMASNLATHLSEKITCYLLQNHGVLAWGTDLQDAFNNLQTLELYARQLTIAKTIGKPSPIPQWRIDEIKRLFHL